MVGSADGIVGTDAGSLRTPCFILGRHMKYLTVAIKKRQLSDLEADAECGLLDRGVKPYLDRINALDGICTQSSCMGHGRNRMDVTYLNLKVSRRYYERVVERLLAFKTAKSLENHGGGLKSYDTDNIVWVQTFYHDFGRCCEPVLRIEMHNSKVFESVTQLLEEVMGKKQHTVK